MKNLQENKTALITKFKKFLQSSKTATEPRFTQSVKPAYGRAFTLAEVLITLGVIGIVAAITLPNLISSYKHYVLHNQLKKSYSVISQFNQKFLADNDCSFNNYNQTHRNYDDVYSKFKAYFNIIDEVTDYSVKSLTGLEISPYCQKFFVINDGMIIGFSSLGNTVLNTDGPIMCVDINGLKAPNTAGMDYFLFVFTIEGNIVPYGTKDYRNTQMALPYWYGSNSCRNTNIGGLANTIYSAAACAYYAISDTHPQDSNKSYWKDFLK